MKKFLLPMLVLLVAGNAWSQVPDQEQTPPPEVLEGRGEYEMVLIHGLGASNEVWDGVLPYLRGTFKVWTFELSGHGATQPILDPTIAKEAERLADFLQDEGIAYPTLVGHGIGGMIALQYCLDNPADVHRLVMIDSAPKQLATAEQKAEVANALVQDYDHFVFNRYSNMSPEPDITEQVVDMALRTHRVSFISLLMSSFDYDVTEELNGMTVPLLVIGSELLFPHPDSTTQVLEQIGFTRARSLVFKRMGLTGHYVMLERPPYTASVLLAFGVKSEHDFGY
jgi:pimeloyl-ACP methyl ester carboxylesterase